MSADSLPLSAAANFSKRHCGGSDDENTEDDDIGHGDDDDTDDDVGNGDDEDDTDDGAMCEDQCDCSDHRCVDCSVDLCVKASSCASGVAVCSDAAVLSTRVISARKHPARPYASSKRRMTGVSSRRQAKIKKLLSSAHISDTLSRTCCQQSCLAHYSVAEVRALRVTHVINGSEVDVMRRVSELYNEVNKTQRGTVSVVYCIIRC